MDRVELGLAVTPAQSAERMNLGPVEDTSKQLCLESFRRPQTPLGVFAATLGGYKPGIERQLRDQRQQKPGTVIPSRPILGLGFIPISKNLNEIQTVL